MEEKTRAVSGRVQGADGRACEGRSESGVFGPELEPSEQTILNSI